MSLAPIMHVFIEWLSYAYLAGVGMLIKIEKMMSANLTDKHNGRLEKIRVYYY